MALKSFIRVLMMAAWLLASMAYSSTQAHGAAPVKIGVLAFRPKPQTLEQWQPLAAMLKQAIPGHDFVVEALTYTEMDRAVASRQLDFILTNSGHYVALEKKNGLSSPLATVIALHKDCPPSTVYGGVIFCRAGQDNINTIRDIKGKTIATVTTEAFAGYQMQAYELSRAGLQLPRDIDMIVTGMPHDKAVEAVLTGHAEVGFVRSGVLEGMAQEGKLDLKQLKIVNPQSHPGFPQQVSTSLYPEWPFVAMPGIDDNLARHVAAALFMLGDNETAAHAMSIQGFAVPADYSSVEAVLRELHLPPFDTVPHVTLHDIWSHYRWQMIGGGFAFGLILCLGVNLLFANRKLVAKQLLLQRQQRQLQESEEMFRTVADYTLGWEYWQGAENEMLYISPSCEVITGHSPAEFIADPDLLTRVIHPDDRQQTDAHRHDINNQEDGVLDFRVVRRDGGIRWIEHVCHPVWSANGVFKGRRISNRDITERKQAEEARMQLSAIVERSLNEIYLIDSETLRFTHANLGALQNLQYTLDELKKLTAVDIKPDFTETAFRAMVQPLLADHQDLLVYETVHRRADGSLYPVEVHLQLMGAGQRRIFLAVIFDITERKQLEGEREKLIVELQNALAQVKQLSGFLPICASCKKIRDDKGYWTQIESYISKHSEVQFSHGLCQECATKLYPELCDKNGNLFSSKS